MDVTLEQIAQVVSEQLAGFESRVTLHVSDEIRKGTEELKQQATVYKDELKRQATVYKDELQQQATAHKDELTHQATLYREALKQDVIAVAGGYGATLEKIDRELAELNEKFDTKFGDHDLALANHHDRITTLENR